LDNHAKIARLIKGHEIIFALWVLHIARSVSVSAQTQADASSARGVTGMEQRHSYSSPIRHSVASEDYLAGYHELRRGADYPRDSVPLLVPRTPLQHAQGGHKDAGATSGWGISSVAKDLFSNNKQPVRLNDNVPGSTISNPISLEQWQSMQAAGSTIVNPISLEQWRSTQAALGPRAKQHWQPPHLGPPMPPEHKSSLPQSAQYRPLPEVEHRPALKNEANSSHPVSMVSPENDQMLALTADSQRMCSQIAASMKNIDDLLTVSCRAGEPFPMPLHPLTLQMHMPHTFMHKPSTQMSGLNT
jgi:hypothetical protein